MIWGAFRPPVICCRGPAFVLGRTKVPANATITALGDALGRVHHSRTASWMRLMLPDGIAETPQPRLQKRA
jgi:hypothetical protein